jgi:hypothetical protein
MDAAPVLTRVVPIVGLLTLAACSDPVSLSVGDRFRVEGTSTGLYDCSPRDGIQFDSLDTALCAGRTDTIETGSVMMVGAEFLVTEAYEDSSTGSNYTIDHARHWNGEGELTITQCQDGECEEVLVGVALMEISRLEAHCVEMGGYWMGPCNFPDGRATYYVFDVLEPIFLTPFYGAVAPADDRLPLTMTNVSGMQVGVMPSRAGSRATWTLERL